jgi:putative transposase
MLTVHISGFCAWLKEPLSLRAQENVRKTDLVRQVLIATEI